MYLVSLFKFDLVNVYNSKEIKQIKFMDIMGCLSVMVIIYIFIKVLDYIDRYKNQNLVEAYMLLERIEYLEDEIKTLKNK